jgi:hypothetical protein
MQTTLGTIGTWHLQMMFGQVIAAKFLQPSLRFRDLSWIGWAFVGVAISFGPVKAGWSVT